MFLNFLNHIQKYLFVWIIVAVAGGLLVVKVFGGYSFTPLICFLAALIMIYPSLIPLNFDKLKNSLRNYRLILFSLAANFILAPVAAFLIGLFFLKENPELRAGLMLLAVFPGGGMMTTWAHRSRSHMPTAVSVIFFNLLAAVFIAPFILSFTFSYLFGDSFSSISEEETCFLENITDQTASCALGKGGKITAGQIAWPMFFILVIPLLAAYLTQKLIKKKKGMEYFEKTKMLFGSFSNWGLVIVLFFLMALNSNDYLFKNPYVVAIAFGPVALFYGLMLFAAIMAYLFYGESRGRALSWGIFLRYITLSLGFSTSLIYQNSALAMVIVPVVLSYFIQMPLSFWLNKYLLNNSKIITENQN